ncbi:MAG TPA: MFS transporter, partial [Anaerolineales bacterium]|nr:MFS transporter [Anaerolineales bacterium]
MKQARLYFGISIFWLALSLLSDGLNTLVLPNLLLNEINPERAASVLGLFTFFGLMAGVLVQPVAGALSDRVRFYWGRRGWIGLGLVFILLGLAALAWLPGSVGLFSGYFVVQIFASVAQAGQQGYIPDLVSHRRRGLASGLKGLMDIGGAMLGFIILGDLLGAGRSDAALALIAGFLVGAYLLAVVLVQEKPFAPAILPDSGPPPVRRFILKSFRLDLAQHRSFAWLVVARFFFMLGTYAVGRFLLFFVADRLALPADQAAETAGGLLAGLAFVTVAATPLAGWAADRWGRRPLMVVGALLSAAGVLLFIPATSAGQILVFGGLMALGSAAFTSANWAASADLAPPNEAARFMALANI